MIVLNGEACDARELQSLADVLARLDLPSDARGVAVAVDGAVVPRPEWASFELHEGAHVEVLTAMQGADLR